jgi:acyl carrier protein
MEGNRVEIRTFLSQFFHVDDLQDDDDIFALGFINSLFVMQMVLWVEKKFAIKVEDEDLDIQNFNTTKAIAEFIERKTSAGMKLS